ncbi:hypothetical protein ONA24_05370 [Mycoplasmopsis cynos]|uniref:ABC transporter permease subunit n=1 Tax=Mycoplasmopsis cynos TaxID=171284 RepID=UPI0024C55C43|nr:hypothetical protein [Mycoplasmopsis cynos]WAM09436.1 hypothetical protein ONA24_05370 [Mycoplasmopsis cynos]
MCIGINVNRVKWQALLIASAVAGIAGSFFAQNEVTIFANTKDIKGFGFIALAIMITSRWRISLSVVISLFFSFLLSFSEYGLNVLGNELALYKDLLTILPYLVTLIIMVASSRNSAGS